VGATATTEGAARGLRTPSARERWGLRGFEIGIALGGSSRPEQWRRDLSRVEHAERGGLHSVWVPEMHFGRGATASPLLALAAFAARTRRLRLATTSLLLPIHDPVALADEAAALDRASAGRLILGLGRGFRAPLFRAFGVDARAKRDLFDAALDTMLARWSDGAGSVRPPRQRPHPPLAVAAFGAKGLAQAARRGLPYLSSPLESAGRVEENLRRHRAGLPEGIDPREIVVPVMRTVHVARDEAEARRVRQALEGEARAMGGRGPRSLASAAAEPLEERVVVGTAAQVRDRLGRLRDRLGIDLLVVRPQVPGLGATAREDALERLIDEVWPALRRRDGKDGK